MGDWTPANVASAIGAALGLAGTIITGLLLRSNTRLSAALNARATDAQRDQSEEDADRAARLAREAQLDEQTRWLIGQYRGDVERLRAEVGRLRDDYERRLAALQADHDRVLAENRTLRARVEELERRLAGGATA